MNFIKWSFAEVDNDVQELLIAQLAEFPFLGFEQKENYLLAYANEHEINSEEVKHLVENYKTTIEIIPDVNWNEKWEREFEPIIMDREVAIRAHFHEPILTVKHEIVITPKMSFGTGHHATTQGMLAQMGFMEWSGRKVFDYGTGTGVLAIYAEKLGAASVIANDIDPWSEENAKENVERNACKNIDVRLGGLEVIPEIDFDCILANINLNVLRESMPILFQKLKKNRNGMILSGILVENEDDIKDIINSFSVDYEIVNRNNWLTVKIHY